MFYHVSETSNAGFLCLHRSECKIGKREDKKKIAETVVIYVRVTDKNERLIFHARYGNCYERPNANKAHELPEYQESARQKLRQTDRQLPFENEENTDCHTAMHVCKGSEYILVRSTSGTELNYNFPL